MSTTATAIHSVTMSSDFHNRLKQVLHDRGTTQSELARLLGVRAATVSDWFRQGTMPGGAVMLRLPALLKVDGHWLLTGEGDQWRDSSVAGGTEQGAAGDSLADDAADQVRDLLVAALRILEGEPEQMETPGDSGTMRVRKATEGEKRALHALVAYEQERAAARKRSKNNG
jgi:transcriptional regulator with XRE-family HTH domain